MAATLKTWAAALKQHIRALYLAMKDPRVPRLAKVLIALVVAYALSPIDLIPDFIPILGYLDDLLLLPLGIWLAIRLIPADLWAQCKEAAARQAFEMPRSRRAAAVIVLIWGVALLSVAFWLWQLASG